MQSPAYRDEKTGTALAMLPDLLTGHQGAHLVVRVNGQVILDGPQAVLVSNNPYQTSDIAGLAGARGSIRACSASSASRSDNAAQAAGLLRKHNVHTTSPSSPPARSSSTPTSRRSRSGSTVNQC